MSKDTDAYIISRTDHRDHTHPIRRGQVYDFVMQYCVFDEATGRYNPVFADPVPLRLHVEQYFPLTNGSNMSHCLIGHLESSPDLDSHPIARTNHTMLSLSPDLALTFHYNPTESIGCLESYVRFFASASDNSLQARWLTAIYQIHRS